MVLVLLELAVLKVLVEHLVQLDRLVYQALQVDFAYTEFHQFTPCPVKYAPDMCAPTLVQ